MALEDIAGYSLRRGLGSGAAGSVWLLRDLGSGRHAVLKRIAAALVPTVEEFRRDLALIRSIDFPHLARLLEVRQTDREWLLISQYVAAGTLTNLLERREPLSLGELVTLISPLAQALAILHRAGLTHGNVSLDNVMFDAEGRPVLTDAGLRLLTAPTPQSAANDLAALGDIARASGGDPRTFTPELFSGDGDEIARRVLRLAAPEPINLGFGDDAPTSTPPPSPAGTSESPAHTAAIQPLESRRPKPTGVPLKQTAAEDDAIRSAGASVPSEGSGGTLPGPTAAAADAGATAAPMILEDLYIGAAKPRSGVVNPGASVVRQAAGSRKARRGRRTAGRATRSRTRSSSRNSSRRPVHGFRARVTSKLPAYGLLAIAGLAALVVLTVGLITVGVLGGPSSSSASAADNQPANSDATASADATPVSPSPAVGTTRWLKTLQGLDAQRSRTFSTLNDAGLDAIYVPGSAPWKSDKSLLASYRDQQLRIEGLRIQIQSLAVEQSSPNTAVLRVVDRLISGTAVDKAGRRTPLPPGQPTSRLIALETTASSTSWRIAEITTP